MSMSSINAAVSGNAAAISAQMANTNILQENVQDINAKIVESNNKQDSNHRQVTRMLAKEQTEMDLLSERMNQSNTQE